MSENVDYILHPLLLCVILTIGFLTFVFCGERAFIHTWYFVKYFRVS